jgi:two-component system KDP operon response regulator KdpE
MRQFGARVLVADDDRAIRRFLQAALSARGYAVLQAASGQEALSAVVAGRPDVLILSLELPDAGGIEVTRRLREWSPVPIIILSSRDREADVIDALDAGADDYITKPFRMGELLARLRAALRHAAGPAGAPVFTIGELTVDLERRRVARAGHEIQLTPTEYDLLKTLSAHAGKVITRHQLLQQVWGVDYQDKAHLLRVNISNLRRKLEPDPACPTYILTEPGVGYRLRAAR